jgi:hypothetical protein
MATKSIFFEKKQIVQNDKIVKANEKKKKESLTVPTLKTHDPCH